MPRAPLVWCVCLSACVCLFVALILRNVYIYICMSVCLSVSLYDKHIHKCVMYVCVCVYLQVELGTNVPFGLHGTWVPDLNTCV